MKAETEAFHLGGSLGSVEVDGGFANVAGNSCEEKEKSREPFVPHVTNMSKKKNMNTMSPVVNSTCITRALWGSISSWHLNV